MVKQGIIFGATEKIGSYLASQISSRGGEIILQDNSRSRLEILRKKLDRIKNNQTFLYCDHSNIQNFSNIDLVIARKFDKLDFVISCLGTIDTLRPISHLDLDDWNKTIMENLTINWYIIKKTDKLLGKSKNPYFVFFSSKEISQGKTYFHAYSTAHGAIKTLLNIYEKEKKKFGYNIKFFEINKNDLSYLSHVIKNKKNSYFKSKINRIVKEIFGS